MSNEKIIDLFNDTRCCLVWLRVLEKPENKYIITQVIERIDKLIAEFDKDKYN